MRHGFGARAGLAAVATCILSGAQSASAVMLVFEPDDYAPGANVSNAVGGVTLATFSNLDGFNGAIVDPYFAPVYVRENPVCQTDPRNCDAFSGTRAFSPYSDGFGRLTDWVGLSMPDAIGCLDDRNYPGCDSGRFTAMVIQLSRPTDYIEISGAFAIDWLMLGAFDSSMNLVGSAQGTYSCDRDQFEYCKGTVTYSRNQRDISYVIVSSWNGVASVDRFRTSVPEPGTLALLGIGLAGLGFTRRRKA